MIKITGGTCSDLCDPHLKMTRRDLLRIGGAGMLGLSLGSLLKLQAVAAEPGKRAGGPGWGTAKNVVTSDTATVGTMYVCASAPFRRATSRKMSGPQVSAKMPPR